MTVTEVIEQCKTILENHYCPRLNGVILYGSTARNQAIPTSDIDLLVLSNEPLDYLGELRLKTGFRFQCSSSNSTSARGKLKKH